MKFRLTLNASFAVAALSLFSFVLPLGAKPMPVRTPSPYRTHSLPAPVSLPDGAEFKTWEEPVHYTRTYYVSQHHPAASDKNPGTEELPFATLQRAADVLKPGECVVVDTGVYRETVRPARGGNDPKSMIGYQARPGAKVVISGAEVLAGDWKRVDAYKIADAVRDKIYVIRVPESLVPSGAGPFNLPNISQYMLDRFGRSKKLASPALFSSVLHQAGMLFQDNRRLTQVNALTNAGGFGNAPVLVDAGPGNFWVDPDRRTIYVWPFDNADPKTAAWEVTVRPQCFVPVERGLGFIRVSGFQMEKVGNPLPMPHCGALSTSAGNHWIIENNTIRQVNSIGMDLGVAHWINRPTPLLGNHIVRNNVIEDCGVTAIAGTGSMANRFQLQIENNVIRRSSYLPVEDFNESAAIKLHFADHCLIRGNRIFDTAHGSGIWLDNNCADNLVTGNLFAGGESHYGAVFVELTEWPNLVDSNVIVGGKGAGIYEHDSGSVIIANNLVANRQGNPIRLRGSTGPRSAKLALGNHQVLNNLFIHCSQGISNSAKEVTLAGNNAFDAPLGFDAATLKMTWQVPAPLPNPPVEAPGAEDFWGRPLRKDVPVAGPFGRTPEREGVYDLGRP